MARQSKNASVRARTHRRLNFALADRHTNTQTYRQTDILITILSSRGGEQSKAHATETQLTVMRDDSWAWTWAAAAGDRPTASRADSSPACRTGSPTDAVGCCPPASRRRRDAEASAPRLRRGRGRWRAARRHLANAAESDDPPPPAAQKNVSQQRATK